MLMAIEQDTDLEDIDLATDDKKDTGRQVDAATGVAAQLFDSVPLNVNFAKAASIEAQAQLLKQLDGAENFFLIDEGDLRQSSHYREEQKQEEDAKFFGYLTELDEQAEQRRREQEEWSKTISCVGGLEMTGAQWTEFARRLRSDQELREKILEEFRQRGMTEEEARRRYERVTAASEIAAIPPNQRTDEQNQLLQEAEADPSFYDDLQASARLHKADSPDPAKPQSDNSLSSPGSQQPQVVRSTTASGFGL